MLGYAFLNPLNTVDKILNVDTENINNIVENHIHFNAPLFVGQIFNPFFAFESHSYKLFIV